MQRQTLNAVKTDGRTKIGRQYAETAEQSLLQEHYRQASDGSRNRKETFREQNNETGNSDKLLRPRFQPGASAMQRQTLNAVKTHGRTKIGRQYAETAEVTSSRALQTSIRWVAKQQRHVSGTKE
jgi:hypothetical protein